MLIPFIISLIGLMTSLYALHLEQRVKHNPDYRPACDISECVSCTKPMKSEYGAIAGISNAFIGITFYSFMSLVTLLNFHALAFIGSVIGLVGSVYLAYILFVKLRVVCIICMTIYIINIALFIMLLRS